MTKNVDKLMWMLLHDLRTPLNVVQEGLRELWEVGMDPAVADLIAKGTLQITTALDFVQTTLDLLKDKSADGVYVPLRQIAERLRHEGERFHVPISVELAGEPDVPVAFRAAPTAFVLVSLAAVAPEVEPLSLERIDEPERLRVRRPSGWSFLGDLSKERLLSLRPGYAAWALAELPAVRGVVMSIEGDSLILTIPRAD
ncbi:MAG: hypothetical protein HC923_04920 [Myxococcales bacterium]|nr:hypothetical protein [Myxococcales bacterium]